MKNFCNMTRNIMFVMYHGLSIAAYHDESTVTLNNITAKAQKTFQYYKLPLHLRQYVADFVGFNTPNKQGWLPLQTAAANGKLEKTLFLMFHGANANANNPTHPTNPLSFAASYNHSVCTEKQKAMYHKIGKCLIYHGANPYKLDESGQTALHQAVISCNIPILQTILKIRGDATVLNQHGQTPYDLAKLQAINKKSDPHSRKKMYAICALFEEIQAPSSIPLQNQPHDHIMELQYRHAISKN